MSRYRGSAPNRRPTLLYRVYRDMRSRVHGRATKTPWIYEGLPFGFKDYAEFRVFALANGFSKRTPSPDRIVDKLGYVPGNIRFVTVKRNYSTSQGRCGSDDEVRGPEPETWIDGEPF